MFCPNCGAENPDNKSFCAKCRRPLNIVSEAAGSAVRLLARAMQKALSALV